MKQHYKNNNKYQILTPNGWEDFDGIFKNENANKSGVHIELINGTSIKATDDHIFYSSGAEKRCKDVEVGDKLDTAKGAMEVIKLTNVVFEETFDIFNAENHVILANEINSHQCDELSFLRQSIAKEFWASIQPGLSTGGKCIVTSTPNMPDDVFAEIWHSANNKFDENGNELEVGKNGFHPLKYTWRVHPDRDEKWKDEEIAKIGSEERFMREHEVQFITFEETLISPIMLDKKQGVQPKRKAGEVRWYSDPKSSEIYIVTLDPAMGTGGDFSAIQVYEMPSMKQVAEWKDNKTIVENQVKILKNIVNEIKEFAPNAEVFWTFENNSMGEAVITHLRNVGEEYVDAELVNEPKGTHKSKKGRKGFNTTNNKKNEACSKLKSWFEGDKMKIYSKPLLSELRAYIAKGVGYEAKLGYNDDLVSATLLFIRVAMFISKWDDRCYEATSYENETDMNEPMPILIV